jgi:hypothetical protein
VGPVYFSIFLKLSIQSIMTFCLISFHFMVSVDYLLIG